MSEINVLVWSNDFLLRWSDFNAESNSAAFEDSHSIVKYRHTWTISSDEIESQIMITSYCVLSRIYSRPLYSYATDIRSFMSVWIGIRYSIA